MVKDKAKGVAGAAEDKLVDVKETGALYKSKAVEELKKNPSTILEDAGEKLEVAKEAAEKKLEKETMEEKVEEVKEKMVPEKEDDGSTSAKKDDSK